MRSLLVAVLIASLLAFVTAQWSNADHEIFDIQAALEKDEGPKANFYSILNLTKGASAREIAKAYRARSVELHPDKVGDNPRAVKRFERLGLIIKVLRDERRDRYDHFLTNGFPRWRGSGYYYARFRPGLVSVFVFLILVTASIQFLVLHLNYQRDRKRLEDLQTSSKLLAWGPRFRSIESGLKHDNMAEYNKNVIIAGEKKVRVPLSGLDLPALPAKKSGEDEKEYWDNDEKLIRKAMAKGTSTQNAGECGGPRRFIDALVTKEMVFVMEPSSKEWVPLDENAAPKPSAKSTWPFSLANSLLAKAGLGREGNASSETEEEIKTPAATASAVASNGMKKKNKKRQ
ncbi:hypothetical protein CBS101457_001742 [Exobasidium rhododendri]|nr:hypothetical protein CBS101457_001742 [Exobasidium rhododendri]